MPGIGASPTLRRPMYSNPPMKPPSPYLPKARLNPTSTHSTPMSPIAKTFCISMARTCLARTMPP